MKNTIFTGMATAIVTPMTADGIDYEALGRFIDFQIENGINAIVDLHGDPLSGDAALTLLQALAAAHDGGQAGIQRSQNLGIDIGIGLAHGAALGVADVHSSTVPTRISSFWKSSNAIFSRIGFAL